MPDSTKTHSHSYMYLHITNHAFLLLLQALIKKYLPFAVVALVVVLVFLFRKWLF